MKKKTSSKAAAPVTAKKEEPKSQPTPVDVGTNRNERPNGNGIQNTVLTVAIPIAKPDPFYTYEFKQPEFLTNRILIEHDDKGTGTVSFTRRGNEELITDPLQDLGSGNGTSKSRLCGIEFSRFHRELSAPRKDFSHLGIVKIW